MKSVPVPVKEGRVQPGDFLLLAFESGRCCATLCAEVRADALVATLGGAFIPAESSYEQEKCRCLVFDASKVPEALLAMADFGDLSARDLVVEEEGLRVSMELLMGSAAASLYFEALEDDLDWFLSIGSIDRKAYDEMMGI